MFFKDFVSVKRQKIKRGASQTYDTPSFCVCEGGGWGRGCMGESVMAFRVKNYEILGVFI